MANSSWCRFHPFSFKSTPQERRLRIAKISQENFLELIGNLTQALAMIAMVGFFPQVKTILIYLNFQLDVYTPLSINILQKK